MDALRKESEQRLDACRKESEQRLAAFRTESEETRKADLVRMEIFVNKCVAAKFESAGEQPSGKRMR